MSLMSPRALTTIRRSTERWMVDTVTVYRDATRSHDNSTLAETLTSPGTVIYSGKARIRPTRGPREVAIGDGVIAMRDVDVLFPVTVDALRIDDEISVVSSDDPVLEGTWFRVTDVTAFSQRASRSVSAVQSQPSKDWPNLAAGS